MAVGAHGFVYLPSFVGLHVGLSGNLPPLIFFYFLFMTYYSDYILFRFFPFPQFTRTKTMFRTAEAHPLSSEVLGSGPKSVHMVNEFMFLKQFL